MSRVSTTSTGSGSGTNSTVSNKELSEQLSISKEFAEAEKARLESELAITNQQKQQLELQMQKSKLTQDQQTQYEKILQQQKDQTTALNNYNNILKSSTTTTTTTTTSNSGTTTSESSSTTTSTSDEDEEETTTTTSESEDEDEEGGSYGTGLLIAGGIGGALGGVASALSNIPGPIGKIAGIVDAGLSVISDIASGIADMLESGISTALQQAVAHQGTISARLYGLQDTTKSIGKQVNAYDTILQDIQSAGFFSNSFVSTKDLIAKIDEYAQAGIIYNIEQRAFIGTIQDQLVTTFDAMQDWLKRTVRIQQSDMTMQFLGLEATLNENLTKWFADTSYLTDKYDSVTGSLIDVISTMNTDETVEFQYSVQKWLGALYSLGANTLIDTITTGINQLATGDVNGLASNTTTQTLFTQAIARAGESFSDWVTTGIDAERIDTLMENIVGLLQDVVSNTEGNNVTRSAYASSVYGVSISDLNAVYNMTAEDIKNLTSSTMTATDAMNSWNTQVENYIMNRVNLAQRLDTVVDNLMFSFGKNIEQSDEAYMGWYVADILDDIGNSTGGNAIVESLFSGAEKSAAGIYLKEIWDFGGDFLENLTDAFGSFLGNGGKTDVETFQRGFTKLVNSIFDWVDILDETRGTGFSSTAATTGVAETGISSSTTTTSTSNTTNETSTAALTQAIDTNFYTLATQAAQVAVETVQSSEQSTTNDANEIYNELFERQNTPIKVTVSTIDAAALNSLKAELRNETIDGILEHLQNGVVNVKSTETTDAFGILSNIKTLI